jgi:conjugative transposon TraK protein
MFKQLKNIDTAFRYVRAFTLVVIVASAFTCCFVAVAALRMVRDTQAKIYVLAGGKAFPALSTDRTENIEVEMRDHVKTFHYYFFTLIPDEKANTANMNQALMLADYSAKDQYDNLRESSYYTNIVSGNVNQQIAMDSIQLDLAGDQPRFRYYGKEIITRTTVRVTRRLITEGALRILSVKSDDNNHGMLVERWRIIDNSDISIEKRGL